MTAFQKIETIKTSVLPECNYLISSFGKLQLFIYGFSSISTLLSLIYWIYSSLNDAAENVLRMLVKVTSCLHYVNQ